MVHMKNEVEHFLLIQAAGLEVDTDQYFTRMYRHLGLLKPLVFHNVTDSQWHQVNEINIFSK